MIDLLPYSLLIVWLTCFAIALIHPVSRAFLHCNLVLFRTFCGLNRMYVESNKQAGQWFSRTTCIAIVDEEGEFVRIFYGKPELMHLMQANKEKQNG